MNSDELLLNANEMVAYLQKPASEFTKADIINFIRHNDIRMVNFMYPAGDGKLKTLNFVINNLNYLETILTCGERVDGSSLFSFISAGSSDLYVVPRFRTASQTLLGQELFCCRFCFSAETKHNIAVNTCDTLHKKTRSFQNENFLPRYKIHANES